MGLSNTEISCGSDKKGVVEKICKDSGKSNTLMRIRRVVASKTPFLSSNLCGTWSNGPSDDDVEALATSATVADNRREGGGVEI